MEQLFSFVDMARLNEFAVFGDPVVTHGMLKCNCIYIMDRRFKHFSEKEKHWLNRNYGKLTIKELSQALGRTRNSVIMYGCKYNLTCKQFFVYDENFSWQEKIQLPEFIYFLGFIWADGHLSRQGKTFSINLAICKEDGLAIEGLMDKVGVFKKTIRQNKGKRDIFSFVNRNQALCKFLFENEFKDKSYVEPSKILSIVPKELHFYFWRGFFDGDGCVVKQNKTRRISFSGTHDYKWDCLQNLLNEWNTRFHIARTESRYGKRSYIIFWRRADTETFYKYIYPNSFDFGLKRKYLKFTDSSEDNPHKSAPPSEII